MNCLVEDNPESGEVFLCPRCGTVNVDGEIYVPMLVERCRKYASGTRAEDFVSEWFRLGIAEAINKPEDRK